MSEMTDRVIRLEKSYDYHLKEMCRHDEVMVWIDSKLLDIEEYLTDGMPE